MVVKFSVWQWGCSAQFKIDVLTERFSPHFIIFKNLLFVFTESEVSVCFEEIMIKTFTFARVIIKFVVLAQLNGNR